MQQFDRFRLIFVLVVQIQFYLFVKKYIYYLWHIPEHLDQEILKNMLGTIQILYTALVGSAG